MKHYEVNILFSSDEKEFKETQKEVLDLFKEHQIEIYFEEDAENKDLAYPILKQTKGHYYHYHIKTDPTKIRILNKEFKLKNQILRFLVIQLDKKAIKHFEKINIKNQVKHKSSSTKETSLEEAPAASQGVEKQEADKSSV